MIDNKIKIAKICNKYFVNIVKNLRILKGKESATLTEKIRVKCKWLFKKAKTTQV